VLPAYHRRLERQSGQQWACAGISVDLELAGRTGLGAYYGFPGFVAEAPCHALDSQGDVFDAFQRCAAPRPTHVADIR
jgi:hypothetical protein